MRRSGLQNIELQISNNWGDFTVPSVGQVSCNKNRAGALRSTCWGRWREVEEQLRNLASCQFFVFFVIPMVGRDGGSKGAGQGTSRAGGNKFLILLNKESQT